MKLLVKYIDHHPDNYQGGSGKSFPFTAMISIDDDIKAGDMAIAIVKKIEELARKQRPYICDGYNSFPAFQSIEILF